MKTHGREFLVQLIHGEPLSHFSFRLKHSNVKLAVAPAGLVRQRIRTVDTQGMK